MRGGLLADRRSQPGKLLPGELAGEFERVDRDRAERRLRTVLPQFVDRVSGRRNQLGAAFGCRLGQGARIADRMQPRIETKPGLLAEIGPDPFGRRIVDQAFDREGFGIGLLPRLQRVAAVDEDHRPVGEHDGDAGGAGKPRQPSQALGAFRDIFALVLVGARHDEAAHPLGGRPFAQPGNALAAERPVGIRLETLEHGRSTPPMKGEEENRASGGRRESVPLPVRREGSPAGNGWLPCACGRSRRHPACLH